MSINRVVRRGLALVFTALIMTSFPAWALDLSAAKAQGMVGEQENGYLGLVSGSAPDAVKALIEDVNNKRRAKYQEVANSRSIGLDQVEKIAGKKAIEKTEPSHFIKLNDQWMKK